MTDLQVMISIMSGYALVLGYVALTSVQQGKKLAVIEKMVEILNNKMDLFVKTETDVLKELAKK